MFGDSEIQPSTSASPFPSSPQPVSTPPDFPVATPAPERVYVPPKPRPSILPLLFGFLLVIIFAAGAGVVYYKTKLATTTTPSPSPSASTSIVVDVESDVDPVSTSSGSPKASAKASGSPKASAKASSAPVVTTRASTAPTPTPAPVVSLDVRFGNPSANIKQTIDEGAGDGRVINREYSSIQAGQFDEVPSVWSPRVTVCFHVVSNQEIRGQDLKYTYTLDGKVEAEGNLGQYDKLEAGRLYDFCRDTTSSIGKHTAKLQVNGDKSLKELNYTNGLASLEWENLADRIAPNYTLMGPNNEGDAGTCLFPQYISDNVTPYADLKIEQKVDNGDWTKFEGSRYCFKGTAGSSHTYSTKITDARGNAHEEKKTFVLY